MIAQNQQTKAESLYTYITSHEFAQQVEAMTQTYQTCRNKLSVSARHLKNHGNYGKRR